LTGDRNTENKCNFFARNVPAKKKNHNINAQKIPTIFSDNKNPTTFSDSDFSLTVFEYPDLSRFTDFPKKSSKAAYFPKLGRHGTEPCVGF